MPDRTLTRRALLRAALPLATLPFALSPRPWRGDASTASRALREALRVGVLLPAAGDADAAALSQGAALGADESARTASLFGLELEVVTEQRGAADDDALAAAGRLAAAGCVALVCDLRSEHCGPIADLAARHDVLVANLGPAPNVPLGAPCTGRSVHLSPSPATVRRARNVYASRPGAADVDGATIATWHHTLRRFGAEQLNERFRRRFGAEMRSGAWAAWVAMKILTESALRARSAAGPALTRHLLSPSARFDGHKGGPMVFDARSGELRQPLYVLRGDVVAADLSIEDLWGVSR